MTPGPATTVIGTVVPLCYIPITVSSIGVGPRRAPVVACLVLALVLVAQVAAWCGVPTAQPPGPTVEVASEHDHSHGQMCDSPSEAGVGPAPTDQRRTAEPAAPAPHFGLALESPPGAPAAVALLGAAGATRSPPSGRCLLTALGIARI